MTIPSDKDVRHSKQRMYKFMIEKVLNQIIDAYMRDLIDIDQAVALIGLRGDEHAFNNEKIKAKLQEMKSSHWLR